MTKDHIAALHIAAETIRIRTGKPVALDFYYAKDGTTDINLSLSDYTFTHRWQRGDTPDSYLASLHTRIAYLFDTTTPNSNS